MTQALEIERDILTRREKGESIGVIARVSDDSRESVNAVFL